MGTEYRSMGNRLFHLSILILLPLFPAVFLYVLFGELNSAGVQWSGTYAVQLGGPVAAYVIVLGIAWRIYKKLYVLENPLEPLLKELEGKWHVESKSAAAGRKAQSETTIMLDDGALRVDGGTFFSVTEDGSKGESIGQWHAEMAVSDGRRLKYFYTLTDSLASPSTWRGLVEADVQPGSKPPTFRGTWQVIGKDFHSGSIVLTKSH
jgi:hypothetical protein